MAAVRVAGGGQRVGTRAARSPYPGLLPFSGEDEPYFFGRAAEREIIAANLIASPLTILYAASGVGKTSVLRAGVANDLEALAKTDATGTPEFLVAVVRRWAVDPIGEIDAAVAAAARRNGLHLPPGRPRLADRLRALVDHTGATLLLIFDQFEEFLLYHQEAWNPGEPAHEIALALNTNDLSVNFLLSIREDALAKLDRFKGRVPHLFENYLRLERLDVAGGREAIERPLAQWNADHPDDPMDVEPEVVDAVLDEVPSGRGVLGRGGAGTVDGNRRSGIEAPFLQLVMARLWKLERARGSRRLRLETLNALGGASEIVRTHVDGLMRRVSRRQRDVASAVFHQLVTPSATKVARSLDDLAAYTGLPRERIEELLVTLSRGEWLIVRAVADDTSGVARYEIFHDVLAEAVLDWRARHEERRRVRRVIRIAVAVGATVALVVVPALTLAAKFRREADKAKAAEATARSEQQASLARLVVGVDPDRAIDRALAATRPQTPSPGAQAALRLALARDSVTARLGGPRLQTPAMRDFEMSPPGRYAITVAQDGTARVWDLRRPARPVVLKTAAKSVAFDPSGRWIAAVGEPAVSVWSPDGGARRIALEGAPRVPVSIAWDRTGRRLLVGGAAGRVALWNGLDRRPRVLYAGRHTVGHVTWSPGGRHFATASGDQVRVWTADGRRLATVRGSEPVVALGFNGDSSQVLVARRNGEIDVLRDDGRQFRCRDRRMRVTTAVFAGDGRYVISAENVSKGTGAPEVRRVDLRDCRSRPDVLALPAGATTVSVAARSDGGVVYVAGTDRAVRVWHVAAHTQLATLTGISGDTRLLVRQAASNGADMLFSASSDGYLRQWQSAAVPVARFRAPGRIGSVAFDPSGSVIAATRGRVWTAKVEDGASMRADSGRLASNTSTAFSGDGRLLAASGGHRLRILALAGRTRFEMPAPAVTTSLAFSPDGSRLITMHRDGVARIWRTDAEAKPLRELHSRGGDDADPYAFFVADGRRAVVVGDELRVFDVASGRLLERANSAAPDDPRPAAPPAAAYGGRIAAAFGGEIPWVGSGIHDRQQLAVAGAISSMAFSPGGAVLATAGLDGLRLWDAKRAEALVTLAGGPVDALAFSSDGRWLVASAGREVLVFACRPCGSLRALRSIAARREAGTALVRVKSVTRPRRAEHSNGFRRKTRGGRPGSPGAVKPFSSPTVLRIPTVTRAPRTTTPRGQQPRAGAIEHRSAGTEVGGVGGEGQQPAVTATPQAEPTPAPTLPVEQPSPQGGEQEAGSGNG